MFNFISNRGFRFRIISLIVISMLPIIFLIQGYILPSFESKFYQHKKDTTRIAVEIAYTSINSIYEKFKSGELKEEEAKLVALNQIKNSRYNESEYFWINDSTPTMIMHPIKPELIGKNLADMKDPNGKHLFVEMVEITKKEGAGFVEYMWSKPKSEVPVKKISYVKEFKPWGWIIGNGVYVDDVKSEINSLTYKIWIVLSITILVAGILVLTFSKVLTEKLLMISEKAFKEAQYFKATSQNISSISGDISKSTNSSAAAIQETSASLEEISSMIKKSVENADELFKITKNSQNNAGDGKKNVEQMHKIMEDIVANNQKISEQVKNNNIEMQEIIKMIDAISNKTNVINDIVFQTKLLSFNASVEAARAGDQGKGFAVVAEEVGKLATMSGASAQEIRDILSKSNERISEIIRRNSANLEKLVTDASKNLNLGITNANQCDHSLDLIVVDSENVNQMVNEISQAFKEQAIGVEEISSAIGNLDLVTQQNASSAKENLVSAEKLNHDAAEIENITIELLHVVNGSAKKSS